MCMLPRCAIWDTVLAVALLGTVYCTRRGFVGNSYCTRHGFVGNSLLYSQWLCWEQFTVLTVALLGTVYLVFDYVSTNVWRQCVSYRIHVMYYYYGNCELSQSLLYSVVVV